MVDDTKKSEAETSNLEVWMGAHPSVTKTLVVMTLVSIGFILGKLI